MTFNLFNSVLNRSILGIRLCHASICMHAITGCSKMIIIETKYCRVTDFESIVSCIQIFNDHGEHPCNGLVDE